MYARLRELRQSKNMTQSQMGKLLCCSQKAYSTYERGESSMPTDMWIRLAKFYGTNVDYLMELTDEKKPYPPRKKRLWER